MGKSWRQDARNDRWRKQKQQKQAKKNHNWFKGSKQEWETIVDRLADEYDRNP